MKKCNGPASDRETTQIQLINDTILITIKNRRHRVIHNSLHN